MVECYFGVGVGMCCHVGYVVGVVAHALFEQAEDVGWQLHGCIGACVDVEGVISAKCLKAKRKHIDFSVNAHMVGALEFLHSLVGAYLRIEKCGGLAIDVIEDVGNAQRTALCHIDIIDARHRHIVLVVADGWVHLIAE